MGIEQNPLKLIEVIDTIDIENCTAKTLIKVIMLDTTDLLHIGVCMCYTPWFTLNWNNTTKYILVYTLTLPPLGGGQCDPHHYIWLRCDLTGENCESKLGDFSGLCFAEILGEKIFSCRASIPACQLGMKKWISEIFVNHPCMIPFWKIHT